MRYRFLRLLFKAFLDSFVFFDDLIDDEPQYFERDIFPESGLACQLLDSFCLLFFPLWIHRRQPHRLFQLADFVGNAKTLREYFDQ